MMAKHLMSFLLLVALINFGHGMNLVRIRRQSNDNENTDNTLKDRNTKQSSTLRRCMENCLVTPEYNPVCGTDNVKYDNLGRLNCAQACGVNVSLMRYAPCPPAATSQ